MASHQKRLKLTFKCPSCQRILTIGRISRLDSTATLQTIVPFTLPKGRWLVTGVLRPDATVALQTLTGSVSIVVDVGVFWTYETVTPAEDGLMVVLSCVVDSDGNDVFSIPAVLTTSGGATYGITDNNTNRVQLTRLA